jgi:hypothetical protein
MRNREESNFYRFSLTISNCLILPMNTIPFLNCCVAALNIKKHSNKTKYSSFTYYKINFFNLILVIPLIRKGLYYNNKRQSISDTSNFSRRSGRESWAEAGYTFKFSFFYFLINWVGGAAEHAQHKNYVISILLKYTLIASIYPFFLFF